MTRSPPVWSMNFAPTTCASSVPTKAADPARILKSFRETIDALHRRADRNGRRL